MSKVKLANLWHTYRLVLIAVIVLFAVVCFIIFVSSGPFWSCVCGLIVAIILFTIRQHHQKIYGASEIAAGLFILYQSYPKGRGAFSSDFSKDFESFQWTVVLISTVTAIYIIVRGLDNFFNLRDKK
jgi:hypothetical protein